MKGQRTPVRVRRQRLLCDVDKRRSEIPEIINRATRRAAASMKRKQKENKNAFMVK
jgi:hypothetical protein